MKYRIRSQKISASAVSDRQRLERHAECQLAQGISWQITPRVWMEALAAGGDQAKGTFEAMMTMKKIDVAATDASRKG
jgi:predicted 3-demethylubiquinone-9 3-methyltransferase (glyoxalase superfamily)